MPARDRARPARRERQSLRSSLRAALRGRPRSRGPCRRGQPVLPNDGPPGAGSRFRAGARSGARLRGSRRGMPASLHPAAALQASAPAATPYAARAALHASSSGLRCFRKRRTRSAESRTATSVAPNARTASTARRTVLSTRPSPATAPAARARPAPDPQRSRLPGDTVAQGVSSAIGVVLRVPLTLCHQGRALPARSLGSARLTNR